MPARALLCLATLIVFFGSCSVASASDWRESIHGEADLDSTGYAQSLPPTNQFLETGRFSLDSTLKYKKDFRIKLAPVFQADPLNNSITERYWVELPEGYAQVQSKGWTLQLGYNTFTWGVGDGFNPLDVVSARRYQDPLRPDKLGAPSLMVKRDWGKLSIEGIYIPRQRESILPGRESRWLPREVLTTTSIGSGDQAATLLLPSNLDYVYTSEQTRDNALNNNVGARMEVQSVVKGLDASIEAFQGAAGTPAVDVGASGAVLPADYPALVIQADPLVSLTPVYYRQWVYGGTIVYADFGMIFRAETAITRIISKGADLPGDAEEYIAEIEKPIPVGERDLTLLVEATYARHTEPLSNSTTSLDRIFDRAAIVGARYSFSERLTAMASGLFDTESHGQFAHIEASYNLTDAWKLGVAGDGIWGSPNTPLGSYNKNDRATVSVKRVF